MTIKSSPSRFSVVTTPTSTLPATEEETIALINELRTRVTKLERRKDGKRKPLIDLTQPIHLLPLRSELSYEDEIAVLRWTLENAHGAR